ncbi:MAG: hypothetical protein P8J33_16140, partial [Pirellulaceae bacterium]|nr:hypothetical protein [Pirellulaceae bacterium]
QLATPEIVLSQDSNIPKYSDGDFTPPVTAVSRDEIDTPGKSSLEECSGTIVTDTNTDSLGVTQVDSVSAQYFTTVTDSTLSDHIDLIEQKIAASLEQEQIKESQPAEQETELTSAIPTPDSEVNPNYNEIKKPGLDHLETELDAPAVLADIVRPTIVPLEQRPTIEGSKSASDLPVNLDAQAEVFFETEQKVGLPVAEVEAVDQDFECTEQSNEVVQLLADFGNSGGSSSDTLTREEMTELFPNLQTYEPVETSPRGTETSTLEPTQYCAFPDDKRSERFTYGKTPHQPLVDSIVDQIFERFRPGNHSTIMLVAANREIDVDSAASRIATCLAVRDTGNTLLVDGNLASRQLTALLGMMGKPGISNAFGNGVDIESLIYGTDIETLNIISAGNFEVSDDHEDLTHANAVNQNLKSHFDYTIVSGGIAGDPLSDAWSREADGIYLIVDMDESDRAAAVATVDYFRQLGARIVGCIATRA